jgi:uncharacterized protein YkwD
MAAVLVLTAAGASAPAPTQASTETSMEASLWSWMNHDRLLHGLRGLRRDGRLITLSGERAGWMATRGLLSHDSVDGSVCNALTTRSIAWYRCGEDIGYTTATWGTTAARYIYNLWKHSAAHWALMMSPYYNYVGIGVARRSNGMTYASIVFLEGPDRTPPVARMASRSVSGTTVRFSWTATDPRLQTHTAGLRDYNVQLRVDNGTWVQIRTATTRTWLSLANRARGHWYEMRVQARDRRYNLSAWSTDLRAWVP